MSRIAPWIFGVAALAIMSGVGTVRAQTAPTGLHKAEDESVMVQSLGVTVDQLGDMEIYGLNGEEIGDVDEVLVDASAKPVAVSADVGGFLGLGKKDVVIGLDHVAKDGDKLKVSMTKDQIEALPEFDD